MNYSLPKQVDINGELFEIRYDFRVILEIIEMLNDPDFEGWEKTEALLNMFYLTPENIRDKTKAVEACYAFMDQNEKPHKRKSARLIDWEQDFDYIIAPINRVLGYECRAVDYDLHRNTGGVHWWTFMSAYMEMGADCLMAQIVTMRDKLARHKKLEKHEREWIRNNRHLIDIRQKFSDKEKAEFDQWIKGGGNTDG